MPHDAHLALLSPAHRTAPALGPTAPSPLAYRVPWALDRNRAPWYTLRNLGDEPARAVHLSLHGDGRLLWQPLLRVDPGAELTFVVRAEDAARDCIAVLRWFRPNGDEYLWRIAF